MLFETIRDTILVILVFIVVLTGIIYISYFTDKKSCTAICTELGYKYSYGYWQGCIVEKPNGKKIRLEQIRDFYE